MLVLSFKPNEGVAVGEDIHITVVSIEFGKVRLGFTAPRKIQILRDNAKVKQPPKEQVDLEAVSG